MECLTAKKFIHTFSSGFASGAIRSTICKPWLDEEEDLKNILFISIHLFDEETKSFYPGSGSN
jgi:hypothetical protein